MQANKISKYSHVLTTPDDSIETHEFDIESAPIDAQNDRYPYSIVWTMLPMISYLLPSIGHTGICSSDGVIHDFGGPYYIAVDNFSFGRPLKYVPLERVSPKQWDEALKKADDDYKKMMHNIITNNCHSHVARMLNYLNYKGRSNYTMIDIWWMCITKSKYVSWSALLCVWVPSLIIIGIILAITLR